jgi:MoaA/NifB/PqqE/SkfB family radical SAM enzyme
MAAVQQAAHPMTFVALELTGRCGLACGHCFAGSGPAGGHGTMTVRDWERVIGEAAGLGVQAVQFIGGEVTLHPGLCALVRRAVAAGLRAEVFSNLTRVTPAQWDVLSLPGVSLATSWYAADPAVHAQVTGNRGAHARTKANIAEAVRRGIPLRAGMVDVAGREHARAGRAELAALGVTRVSAPDRVRRLGRAAEPGTAGGGDVSELCGRCGRGMAAVSPDGDVWPCVMSRWLPAGNVLTEGLAGVLAGPRWQAVLAGIPAPRADACNPDDDDNCKPKQDTCTGSPWAAWAVASRERLKARPRT